MKNNVVYVVLLALLFFFQQQLNSQTPQGLNYQAVARDANGLPLTSEPISIRVSILTGSASGSSVYTETHDLSTNSLGLFTLIIGEGVSSDDFSAIDWATGGGKWLQIEMDVTGGSNYLLMGTSQLLSVPYALFAQNASNGSSQWNSTANGIFYNSGSIGVGTNSPDPSSVADFSSDSQGLLLPRLTQVQRDSIFFPATGLVIYNKTTDCINIFKQQGWWEICGNCLLPNTPTASSNQPVCEGDTLKLFASPIAGAMYNWSGPNGFTSNQKDPMIINCSLADTGVYSVYTSNICGNSSPATTNVVIDPSPTPADAGPDQTAVSGTTAQLAGNIPVFGSGLWSILSGSGGNINDSTSPASLFTGIQDSTYFLRWTISNNCGISTDDVIIGFSSPWVCGDTITDPRDGQRYGTVQIGTQCWMSQNMNIGTRINASLTMTDNSIFEKYCYNNDSSICLTNGGLYQWGETMQYDTTESTQGICPQGWHVCSDQEFKDLEMALGMTQAQADLGNAWRGTDQGTQLQVGGGSGYECLLSGNAGYGSFGLLGNYEYNWTTTEAGTVYAWRRCIRLGDPRSGRWNTFPKAYGFSVRCLKN
ncbi:MAG: hypothetical protein K8S00_11860 [Bacteroidales bacterium]|nr:hypothetical protein [Bacteroidales bacterium]